MGLLMDPARYAAKNGAPVVRPVRLPLYNGSIVDIATTAVHVHVELAHKARLNDFASYEAAKCWAAKLLCKTVNKVWYNDLKYANTL
jgi:hypothetical protein